MVGVDQSNFWLNGAILIGILLILAYLPNFFFSTEETLKEPFVEQTGGCGSTSACTPTYGLMKNSFWSPSYSWLDSISYYFPFPMYRPYWYRNYGEMTDPYYPKYYQTYWDDSEYYANQLPYFYYNNKSFDKYRKTWVTKPGKRCKRH